MSQDNEIVRLENFVSKLLESFRELREENGRLIQEIQTRDETIVHLREQLTSTDIERGEISNRVSRIIEQIEKWETSLGEDMGIRDVPANDANRQGSLFSIEVNNENEGDESSS